MYKFLNLVLLIFSFSTLQSQNYNSYSKQFNSLYGAKNEVDITHLKRFGFQDVFNYNDKDFIENKDSVHVISKIKYVCIKISENLDVKAIIENLESLPNLEYIRFNTPAALFRDGKVENIVFPNNLYKLKNVKTVSLKGDFYWNYDVFINTVSKLPNLENLSLIYASFPSKVFQNPNFHKLKHLLGLSYSGSNKIQFPESIKEFTNLTSLSLSFDSNENSKKELSKLYYLPNLKFLNLSYITIEDISLPKFKYLKELSLSSVEIKNSDNFFSDLSKIKSLESLILLNNKLSFPKEIPLLKSLKNFYSSNNSLGKTLPNNFYNLTNLRRLEIQGSKVASISNDLNNLKKLTILKLYFNEIKTLPNNISGLSNLQKLFLNNNLIEQLPVNIELPKLSYLNLDNNNIQYLPNSITNLKNLDTLNLEENYIKKLPKDIGSLKNLKQLNLELNDFTALPKSIKKLENLENLNISRNKITELPSNFGNLHKLKTLDAGFCLLEKLPTSFGKLKSLEKLVLTNNNLQSLSKNFGELENLKKLYLYNREYYNFVFDRNFKRDSTITLKVLTNNITALPYSFSNLSKLDFIELSLNQNIDENILFDILKKSKFKNYIINLEKCNIKKLPDNHWNTIKAASIDIRDNLITSIPKDIVNAEYLNELNLNRNKGINTYRANKTQLQLLFVEEGFIKEQDLEKTDELAIAYAKTANRKIRHKEYKKGVEYAEKAFSINKKITNKYLYKDSYIEALYYSKNYHKSILFANNQIKKDTSEHVRFLNSIIPNFKYKAKSELAIGDTIQALKTLEIVSTKFNGNKWTEAGMLSKKINKDSLSKKYFEESYQFYKKYINNNPKAWGYHLSLIEAYIIGDNIELAKEHIKNIKFLKIDDKNYSSLVSYFEIIIKIIEKINYTPNFAEFKNSLEENKVNLKSWSFQLIEDWVQLASLNKTQKIKIIRLNNLYK